MNTKVKVISSEHPSIQPGMIGECNEFAWDSTQENLEITLRNILNFTTKRYEKVTVMMNRKELEFYEH